MTCERHDKMYSNAATVRKTKDQIYQELRWIKCTCTPQRIWCDFCRGSAVCALCSNRDGTPITPNYKYCPRCGGTQKCLACKQTGETIKQ